MKLETILALLYRNKLENVITRAIQLDQNIPFNYSIDEEVIIEVSRSEIKNSGMRFVGNDSWGNLKCTIVSIDKYDLENPYIVMLPVGITKRVSEQMIRDRAGALLSEVEALPIASNDTTQSKMPIVD